MILNPRSERNLRGVHPDLVRVVHGAATLCPTPLSFIITEGLRTPERQAQLYEAGATRTLNSRHLTGHAVDLAATVLGEVRWDWPCYLLLAEAMKRAAAAEKVELRWGGTWKRLSTTLTPITGKSLSRSFPDGPHYELDWKEYPL